MDKLPLKKNRLYNAAHSSLVTVVVRHWLSRDVFKSPEFPYIAV